MEKERYETPEMEIIALDDEILLTGGDELEPDIITSQRLLQNVIRVYRVIVRCHFYFNGR